MIYINAYTQHCTRMGILLVWLFDKTPCELRSLIPDGVYNLKIIIIGYLLLDQIGRVVHYKFPELPWNTE